MDEPLVLFLIGLSGVGKTDLASGIVETLKFIHLDIDPPVGDGIDECGIREEWEQFLAKENPTANPLAKAVADSSRNAGAPGAVLSFPSTAIFHRSMIDLATGAGIRTVLLYGSPESCLTAFLDRERATGRKLPADVWRRNNARAAELYEGADYAGERLEAFKPDGSRCSRAEMVASVKMRLGLAV